MSLRLSACIVAALVRHRPARDPPNKEMDQAQGAIDAARAAGADRYASTEYTAATDALKRAQDAVAQRDYRQALNEALDSREHAQNAAREAADTKAQLRGEVERDMAQIAALIAEANTRLAAASRTACLAPRHRGAAQRARGRQRPRAKGGRSDEGGRLPDRSHGITGRQRDESRRAMKALEAAGVAIFATRRSLR